jgi:hypothetical protein
MLVGGGEVMRRSHSCTDGARSIASVVAVGCHLKRVPIEDVAKSRGDAAADLSKKMDQTTSKARQKISQVGEKVSEKMSKMKAKMTESTNAEMGAQRDKDGKMRGPTTATFGSSKLGQESRVQRSIVDLIKRDHEMVKVSDEHEGTRRRTANQLT